MKRGRCQTNTEINIGSGYEKKSKIEKKKILINTKEIIIGMHESSQLTCGLTFKLGFYELHSRSSTLQINPKMLRIAPHKKGK